MSEPRPCIREFWTKTEMAIFHIDHQEMNRSRKGTQLVDIVLK